MENVIILGSGLSGLISSYRIKESGFADSVKMYERNPSVTRRNSTAAFYCHQYFNDELTKKNFEVSWKVYTEYKDKAKYRKLYAKKVYGEEFDGTVSIKNGNEVGWNIEVDKLIENADIEFNMNCTDIDINKRIVTFNDEVKVPYDTLVVTIPMPLFLILSNRKKRVSKSPYIFKCEPIYYSVVKRLPKFEDYNKMILTYFPDPDVPYYRKTYWGENITTESMIEFDGSYAVHPGKLWECEGIGELRELFKSKGIYFQGRYARWERKDLTHMVWNRIVKEIYG